MRYLIAFLGLVGLVLGKTEQQFWCPYTESNFTTSDNEAKSGRSVRFFESTFVSHGQVLEHGLPEDESSNRTTGFNHLQTALVLVNSKFPHANFKLTDHYLGTNGISHAYFVAMTQDNHPIMNFDFNVNIDSSGHIFSYGYCFNDTSRIRVPDIRDHLIMGPREAFDVVAETFSLRLHDKDMKLRTEGPVATVRTRAQEIPGEYNVTGTLGTYVDPKIRFVYWGMTDGSVVPTWEVQISTKSASPIAYVDVITKKIIGAIDQAARLTTFKVNTLSTTDPTKGPRTVVEDPWDYEASTGGWLMNGDEKSDTTRGNNVVAQSVSLISGRKGWYFKRYWRKVRECRPKIKKNQLQFRFNPENGAKNCGAAVTQVFYTVNKMHDVYYKLGFTEAAGNFQNDNFGKGGKGNDAIRVNIHHSHREKNAVYYHAVDGIQARIDFGVNTQVNPHRDSVFDTDVVIHEYTHGLSARLTGGPSTSHCLFSWEALGLSEGWSDFMAMAMSINSTSQDQRRSRPFGAWFIGQKDGFRAYPYSTSCLVNPVSYENLDGMGMQNEDACYEIGALFANILFDLMWRLVDKHGLGHDDYPEFFPDTVIPTDGRYLTMRLVMDAMALQPCNPSMIHARDAILDADTILTNGENHCQIWLAFAKRHVGMKSKSSPREYPGFAPPQQYYKPRKPDVTIPRGVCRGQKMYQEE